MNSIASPTFDRRDTSLMGRWWRTVDRGLLCAVLLLMVIGVVLSVSASPCVAAKIGFDRFFFVKRHLVMLPIALVEMVSVSMMSPAALRRLALGILVLGLIALIWTLISGYEAKGARRWIRLAGFSFQPSEFVKPALFVVVASLLEEKQEDPTFPGFFCSLILLGIIMTLTLLQPDVGMTLVLAFGCLVQFFMAGMPLAFALLAAVGGTAGLSLAYFFIPHVTKRIDAFFHPELGDADQLYQIRQSLEAFHHGGWFGCGPGEGIIKRLVPDAHADFVFSVAGEEYGIFLCLFIVALFAWIVVRSLLLSLQKKDDFVIFSVTGLSVQIGAQACINMATSLKMIPTKGMTLPFVSYGGSSILAMGLTVGMILALTKKQHGIVEEFI